MYIVGFNGPPYSGKDTLASFVSDTIEARVEVAPVIRQESLSLPLRSISYAMIGSHYGPDTDTYDEFKKTFFPQFQRTGRELMIDSSESFLKRLYGKQIMAKMLIERNRDMPDNGVLLVRDSGFQCEVDPLMDAVGMDRLAIVRIHRYGHDFSADSREWVEHPNPLFNLDIENDGGLLDLGNKATKVFEWLRGRLEWKF